MYFLRNFDTMGEPPVFLYINLLLLPVVSHELKSNMHTIQTKRRRFHEQIRNVMDSFFFACFI